MEFPGIEDLFRKVTPELGRDDIVFLGDYIDRPDACSRIELIIRLREERLTVTTGEPRGLPLRTMEDYTRHSWLIGRRSTRSQATQQMQPEGPTRGRGTGLRLVTERVRLPYEFFFHMLPPTHLTFLQELKLYHRSVDVVCSHGGVDPARRKVEEQEREALIWGGPGFPESYQGGELLAYAHWDNAMVADDGWPQPRVIGNRTFGLDTISHGVLTAIRFPDLTVFQSERYPVL
jgi:hypothetical protein